MKEHRYFLKKLKGAQLNNKDNSIAWKVSHVVTWSRACVCVCVRVSSAGPWLAYSGGPLNRPLRAGPPYVRVTLQKNPTLAHSRFSSRFQFQFLGLLQTMQWKCLTVVITSTLSRIRLNRSDFRRHIVTGFGHHICSEKLTKRKRFCFADMGHPEDFTLHIESVVFLSQILKQGQLKRDNIQVDLDK